MSKKEENHPKIELLFQEREKTLEQLREIDDLLLSRDEVDIDTVMHFIEQTESYESFSRLSNWLKSQMDIKPENAENRLNATFCVLEKEFPATPKPILLKDEGVAQTKDSSVKGQPKSPKFDRSHAIFFTMILLDNAILLHALGHNTSAIIELYGALERYTINALCNLLIVPERVDIGLKLIERRTLPDISSMLSDCGVFEKEHTKFCNRLSRLRNGLAHRNAEVVSRAILGGQDIGELEIDVAVTDEIFYEYLIGTIKACIVILIYQSEHDIEPIPIGFFSENSSND